MPNCARQSLLKVLADGLISGLLRLLLGAKRCQLRLTAKLTRLQTLLKGLLLRLVLRGLCGKRLLEVLAESDVIKLRLLHACTKAREGGLVSEHGARLLFSKRLLTRCLVEADALCCSLQQKVVFLLHLRRHRGVIRLATRSQALVY